MAESARRGILTVVVPAIRPEVYDAYWEFAAERQQIFYRRLLGKPGPWTDNPVLAAYKFCNSFRASDRVSQYLIKHVIYATHGREEPEDLFLRIILFRLFSRPTTWRAIEEATGGLTRKTLDVEKLARMLDELRVKVPIYTSAFILCANDAYGERTKHRNHLMLVRDMFDRHNLGRQLAHANSLREVYELLLEWPLLGPFMSYQLAIDLNYSEYLAFSEDDFTVPGPGAIRGLRKVFSDFCGMRPSELIMMMVQRQEFEFARLGLKWEGLFGRALHAIDAQGLFCEIDKYSRVAFPHLQSNRKKIKHRFRPATQPLELFYPPKWDLNSRIVASRREL